MTRFSPAPTTQAQHQVLMDLGCVRDKRLSKANILALHIPLNPKPLNPQTLNPLWSLQVAGKEPPPSGRGRPYTPRCRKRSPIRQDERVKTLFEALELGAGDALLGLRV